MPFGATVIHADADRKTMHPCIWAICDPSESAEKQERRFTIVGTGEVYDDQRFIYCGTFQQGPFVWHIMEVSRTQGTIQNGVASKP